MSWLIKPNTSNTPSKPSRVDEFLAQHYARARIILACDATYSREGFWERSIGLTYEMFNAVAAVGTLDLQLVYYKGYDEWFASQFVSDPKLLTSVLGGVRCKAGYTQLKRVLKHGIAEHAKNPTAALIAISDACEENSNDLYAVARELKVPTFLFQEGHSDEVAAIYGKIAEITGGALVQFDSSSAARLADLLKGVAAYATGGIKALSAQNTAAARLLLTQIKK